MKQTSKITLCGICVALSVVTMLLGYFPYFTYAVPAIAGLFMMIPLIEINGKYAFLSYVAGCFIVFIVAEPETKVLYIVLFGYYPILKAIIEKIKKPIAEWIVKILCFNASVVISYYVLKLLTNINVDDFGPLGKYGAVIFIFLCNIAFILYDIAISRVSFVYFCKMHPKIKGIFGK